MSANGKDDVCVWDAFGAFWCESQEKQAQGQADGSRAAQGPVGVLFEGFSSSVKAAADKIGTPSMHRKPAESHTTPNRDPFTNSAYKEEEKEREMFSRGPAHKNQKDGGAPVPSAEGFCGCML
jgi:hypothetical protein